MRDNVREVLIRRGHPVPLATIAKEDIRRDVLAVECGTYSENAGQAIATVGWWQLRGKHRRQPVLFRHVPEARGGAVCRLPFSRRMRFRTFFADEMLVTHDIRRPFLSVRLAAVDVDDSEILSIAKDGP